MNKKNWFFGGFLLLVVFSIRLFSAYPILIEQYYSTGIYPYISLFFRSLTGWTFISMGDIVYGLTGAWLIWKGIRAIKAIHATRFTRPYVAKKTLITLQRMLLIYIIFNLCWGLNYNRVGIAEQLDLKMDKYTTQELKSVNEVLLQKINACKTAIAKDSGTVLKSDEIFKRSIAAYSEAEKKYPFLYYQQPSVKSALWGWLGNYIGFNGYYNPFTGEAQVNTTIPKFLQPFTTCHEIAHQLGYAKENEANFVGYLSATASKDSFWLYSTYLDMFLYADRNLYAVDSTEAKLLANQLLPAVKADLRYLRAFNLSHMNAVEPIIKWVYGKYLQSNQQPNGVLTYDQVTAFLIAYHKKFGDL